MWKHCCSTASAIVTAKVQGESVKKLAFLSLINEKGATLNETFGNGDTLLSLSLDNSPELFDFVLAHTKPGQLNALIRGDQLIHLVSKCRSPEPLKFLLKVAHQNNIDVNALSISGSMSPLCYAAHFGNRDNCMLLLGAGANPDLMCDGKTASKFAKRANFYDLAAELKTFETSSTVCCQGQRKQNK